MKNLKKAVVKRGICVFLTAAMLCADTGVTIYATSGSEQEILEEAVKETLAGEAQAEEDMLAKEPFVDDGQIEDTTTGEMQEDSQTEEPSKDNKQTEGDLAEEGATGESSSEKMPVKGENTDENSGGEDAETDVTEEGNPVMEDGTTEENPNDADKGSTGDMLIEESVSENDIEENLEAATKDSGDIIASGEDNDITWVINTDGKLMVEGEGDFS